MSIIDVGVLFERVRDICFRPRETWHLLKDESISFGHVLTDYALPLAVIPPFFGMLGYAFIGIKSGFGTIVYRIPLSTALLWGILSYILSLVGLVVLGIVINALAPAFDSEHNTVNAFKLAVYSSTPVFIAGVLNIVPTLGFIVFLISLYGIFLLYCGLPVMMETPKNKIHGYLIAIVIANIILSVIIWGIAGTVLSGS